MSILFNSGAAFAASVAEDGAELPDHSIALAIIHEVDSSLAGKSAATAGSLFTEYANPDATRNPAAWCADNADLSCMGVFGSNFWLGVKLADDIVAVSNHVGILIPSTMVFLTADGVPRTLTLTAKTRVGSTDIDLCLATGLTTGLANAKFFSPAQWTALQSSINAEAFRVPTLGTNETGDAIVHDCRPHDDIADFKTPTNAKRLEFHVPLDTGDSSHGNFFPYNGQLVIDNLWFHGIVGASAGDGDSFHHHREDIEAAMATLGSGSGLTEVTG